MPATSQRFMNLLAIHPRRAALVAWGCIALASSAVAETGVGLPAISPPGVHHFDFEHTFSLSVDTPGAVIRYTLDGSIPDHANPLYSGPITLDRAAPKLPNQQSTIDIHQSNLVPP